MYRLSGVVKNYTKRSGTVAALRGVDLVIEDGEWLAIQGPTGHGKSTLLQIIGGLDRPAARAQRIGLMQDGLLTVSRATSRPPA
jgi:putative ABC transport system ATP-binding protein